MKPADISNTDKINYLNIGLMLVSCALAFVIPFELFLFAYAVLGPAHYLTEISWLHERKYFTKGKYDFVLLGGLAIMLFLLAYVIIQRVAPGDREAVSTSMGVVIFLAFTGALIMVVAKNLYQRLLGFLLIAVLALWSNSMYVFLTVFLPTLIHVYIFTGFFILYGALKSRSKSGYLSFGIFLFCPLLFFFITPEGAPLYDYTYNAYVHFAALNKEMLELGGEVKNAYDSIFKSNAGLIAMRFIAFAYTYHYLNWFSKTSIIKWHAVSKKRLGVIGLLWAASVGLYLYDYKVGFDWLFCLSFMHVFLEFPLNHTTIIGTFRELRAMRGGKAVEAPAVAVQGKKKGAKASGRK